VQNEAGEVVRQPGQAPSGSRIRALLAEGEINATVV
jgi:hypothetical protein